MDYVIFYSNFSSSCAKLFQEFPQIMTKAVSVDSLQMRSYLKTINIVCVPTLVVILNNKIVDRIVGDQDISNWLTQMVYQASRIQPTEGPVESVESAESVESVEYSESTELVQPVELEEESVTKLVDEPEVPHTVEKNDDDEYSMEALGPPGKTTGKTIEGKTDLSTLILKDDTDSNESSKPRDGDDLSGTMQAAEQMRRQRQQHDNDISSNKPVMGT